MNLTIEQALTKGEEAYNAGSFKEADQYFTAILKVEPNHSEANHSIGMIACSIGKVLQSIQYFKIALKSEPNRPKYWRSYIHALIKLNKLDDAVTVYETAKSKFAHSDIFGEIEQLLGGHNAKIKHVGTPAEKENNSHHVNTTTQINKKPTRQQIDHLNYLYSQGNLTDGLSQTVSLLAEYPDSISLINLQAAMQFGLGDFVSSLANYRKILAFKPNHVETLHNIGVILMKQGKIDDALISFNKVIELNPEHAIAYNNIGGLLRRQGHLADALKAYHKAISINPELENAHYNLGVLLLGNNDLLNAISAFDKALSLNSNNTNALHNKGVALKQLKKFKDASDCFDKVDTELANVASLECALSNEDYGDFNRRLASITNKYPTNIRVAAMSSFAAHVIPQDDTYPFCSDAINMISYGKIEDYVERPSRFIKSILREMNQQNSVWEPERKTTKGGFQSGNKIFSLSHPDLKVLEDIIIRELKAYKSKFEDREMALIKDWPDDINLSAWYVRLLQSGHQESHIHPAGWVSGVVYLKTVKDPVDHEGAIQFGLRGMDYPPSIVEMPIVKYQPTDGDLVLFPSSLYHGTIPVQQDVERCVIAFDLLPKK